MKSIVLLSALILILLLAGCSGSKEKLAERTILAKVNGRTLTAEDLQMEIPKEYKNLVTLEQKRSYVYKWIQSEMLYQVALKKGVEKEVGFLIEQAKKDVVVSKFLEKELKNIEVTSEEIENYYNSNRESFKRKWDEVRASHILLFNKKDAQKALQRIRSGEEFEKIAGEMTEDQNTRMKGGDLGYFNSYQVLPQIAEVAFSLPLGKVSPTIHTEQGFHIIKVTDKKPQGSIRGLEEVREGVGSILLSQRRMKEIEKIIEEHKSEFKIEKFNWAGE